MSGDSGKVSLVEVAALVCSIVGVMLLVPAASSALLARGHTFQTSFGGAGPGDGELSAPTGVAVDEASGEVYVADSGNERVEIFKPGGPRL